MFMWALEYILTMSGYLTVSSLSMPGGSISLACRWCVVFRGMVRYWVVGQAMLEQRELREVGVSSMME